MNHVRRIRRDRDMTQYELSKRTQIPQFSLSLIERFFKKPSLKMMRKISSALGCPIKEIFPEQNSR